MILIMNFKHIYSFAVLITWYCTCESLNSNKIDNKI